MCKKKQKLNKKTKKNLHLGIEVIGLIGLGWTGWKVGLGLIGENPGGWVWKQIDHTLH